MTLIPLSTLQAVFPAGEPLPWHVLNKNGHVLWLKGAVPGVGDCVSINLARELFVDQETVLDDAKAKCNDRDFFTQWSAWRLRLILVLRNSSSSAFLKEIEAAATGLVALASYDTDKLIYAIVRHDHSEFNTYGYAHAQHVASLAAVLTHRMGWPLADRIRLTCAALTMNLSILELQGQLAVQGGRLSPTQRSLVYKHPEDSVTLLQKVGLTDELWLTAVSNHHEQLDGQGYPNHLTALDNYSRVLHLIDTVAAKHAARHGRHPVPPADTVKSLELDTREEAVQLRELLSPYPPGCFIRLASGECAVVLRRAMPFETGPTVAVIFSKTGQMYSQPEIKQVPLAKTHITCAIADNTVLAVLNPQKLYGAIANRPGRTTLQAKSRSPSAT